MKSADALDMERIPRKVAGPNRSTRVQSAAASARHGWSARQVLPESLIMSQRGSVTLLRISRAAKRNALDGEIIAGIEMFFRYPPEGTRVIVLHGDGSHFSAGVDLSTITDTTAATGIQLSRACHRAFEQIEYGQVPVIAVLHGAVIGAGLELAAAAHVRVAERSAYYALPEGTRGIFVGCGGSVRIPRLIGTARMLDMMLTGRTYGAEEGAPLGFSQYMVADGQGLAKGIELAERMAANAVLSNFAIVQALPRIARADPETGLLMESLMAAIAASDDEAKARVKAFLEKRASKVTQRSDAEPAPPTPAARPGA
jgi:enoyl-CoA hydratase/carnithine racemase